MTQNDELFAPFISDIDEELPEEEKEGEEIEEVKAPEEEEEEDDITSDY